MSAPLTTEYNEQLVILSVAIAILASYTTLHLAGRVTATQGKEKLIWLITGATAMGIGIWAMHFIGMLAFYLPLPVTYDFSQVLISVFPAIAASGLALFLVSRSRLSWLSLAIGSLLMGAGIASMHYLGMVAMQIQAMMTYNWKIVALSVILAIIISFVALLLVFRLREDTSDPRNRNRILGAIIMGAAIPTMHYTGMAAVTFYPKSGIIPDVENYPAENATLLAISVTIGTLIILGLTLLTVFFERRLSAQLIKVQIFEESQEYLKRVLEAIKIGVLVIEDDHSISLYNQAILDILNISKKTELTEILHQLNHANSDLDSYQPIWEQIKNKQPVNDAIIELIAAKKRQLKYLLINAIPLEKNQNNLSQIICTFSDITSLKQTEKQLKESELNFRLLAQEEEVLNEISNQIRQSLELNTILQTAVNEVHRFSEADRAVIYQFDASFRGKVAFEKVSESWSSVLGEAADVCFPDVCLQSYRDGKIRAINNVVEANLDPRHLAFLQRLQVQANLVVPIVVIDRLWGLLIIHQCSSPRIWQEREANLLNRLAIQLGIAIQQSSLYEQAKLNTRKQEILNEISTQIRQSLDLNTILQTVVHEVRQFFITDRAVIYKLDENGHGKAILEDLDKSWPSVLGEPADSCFSETYIQNYQQGNTIAINNVEQANLKPEHLEFLQRLRVKAKLIVPIMLDQNLWGLLAVHQCQNTRIWLEYEEDLLNRLGIQLGIAIQQANLYSKAEQNALQAQAKAEELKQALEELTQTQSQLVQSEKMSSLGQLVAGVAHEINNPVNFIHGNLSHLQTYLEDLLHLVELYRENYPDPVSEIKEEIETIELDFLQADLLKILNSMKEGTNRIRGIVLSLRNFSRMDEAEFKEVNIHEGIDSTLMILQHRLKPSLDQPEIKIAKNYGELPLVECYAGPLNQVFMNILSNAIDALEDLNSQPSNEEIKQKLPQITITTSLKDEQWIEIVISDNGTGIPEDIKSKIFDPFFTTKEIGKGTGLGMSISYQIITEKHRGKIECHSTMGVGTKFIISIPVKQ